MLLNHVLRGQFAGGLVRLHKRGNGRLGHLDLTRGLPTPGARAPRFFASSARSSTFFLTSAIGGTLFGLVSCTLMMCHPAGRLHGHEDASHRRRKNFLETRLRVMRADPAELPAARSRWR